MKVTMNSIGNYTPQIRPKPGLNPAQKQKAAGELNKYDPVSLNKNVTEEEKKFFAGMYPENKDEIIDYHFYQKSGKMSGVKVGSQFDRKG